MAAEGSDDELNSAIESLFSMFNGVLYKDAIKTVVESCGGDLSLAVDVIMNISNDVNLRPHNREDEIQSNEIEPTLEADQVNAAADHTAVNQNSAPNSFSMAMQNTTLAKNSFSLCENNETQQPSTSHLLPFQKYGAVPKLSPIKLDWNDQIRRIIENHNKGSRILIILRGAPGSGKSHLAKKIVEMMVGGTYVNFRTHICSTDDYFMSRGKYYFNKHNLSEAHAWNQNRARLAMQQGLSPIFIDNTNIEIWEMEPYVRNAVQNGYILEVVEPSTSWARKPNQLARKNIHNVPIATIKRMLDNYESNITGDYLLKYFNLTYPSDRTPPVLRLMPEVQLMDLNIVPSTLVIKKSDLTNLGLADIKMNSRETNIAPQFSAQHTPQTIQQGVEDRIENLKITNNTIGHPNLIECNVQIPLEISSEPNQSEKSEVDHDFEIIQECNSPIDHQDVEKSTTVCDQYLEVQKQLEEIEKVDQEWENGENWEEVPQTSSPQVDKDNNVNCPKPPRGEYNTDDDNLINIVSSVQDWRQIYMFMPPWHSETTPTTEPATITEILVETTTNGTSMESGDFDQARNNFKIISACPRDINLYHIETKKEKIPDKRMLDRSTMTNEQLLTNESRKCLNEEKHFSAFRNLFKNINKTALRDIFDRCMGDVNWAVDIVLDGVAANQIETVNEEQISDEDVTDEMCTCLSAYHIVPDTSPSPQSEVATEQEDISVVSEMISVPKKPSKRELVLSDASVELKRQIEQNVVIADSHYSQHCLKIMRFRRGYPENSLDENQPSTSQYPQVGYQDTAASVGSDDEDESSASLEEVEKTVNITLGREFIAELDKLFGRTDMSYPDNLVPKINIPLSLLNEINALWMESLMYQLDEHERQRAKMLQEDEDFARALALKEAELAVVGKEPEVLDFKEIMDMDLSLSLYQRDVAGWREKEPNDLAAKLTRDKLFSLFPDVSNDILAELLMAHDNNFQNTVEVLLMSTGKARILKEKDGVKKFVMNKEIERQGKILEAERKALSEVEWPLLPSGEVPDMTVVNEYRDVADRHLHSRNTNIQKASDYLSRGMLTVAGYYRELADFHKLKFEQSNSLAAVSLMQLHAAKCPDTATIDLHYLRVSEAKESLDLFIDTHIQKLKSNHGRGAKHHTLYFITGRGLHSKGRPRIKPAVQKRLKKRGLVCNEVNPGLLSTRVCADDVLSHQLA